MPQTQIHMVRPIGETLYMFVMSGEQVWDTSAFVDYATIDRPTYSLPFVEVFAKNYFADVPAIASGVYDVVVYSQAGVDPDEADIAVGADTFQWSGTAITGTPIVVSPPSSPSTCTLYCITYKDGATLDPGATINFRMIGAPGIGQSYEGLWGSKDSDDTTALFEKTDCPQGATFDLQRDRGPTVRVIVGTDPSQELPNIISGANP